ncbi:hypothetical protein FQR65_LT14198 [Abscondita terminalis]|nr:hypothetical protein FQR65_LT14198 [Abscondita terminalis]
MDEAYLNITSVLRKLYVYSVYNECYKNKGSTLKSHSDVICEFNSSFEEFGVYNFNVTDHGCSIETLKEPVNIYWPIITVFCIYAVVLIVLFNFLYLLKVYVTAVEPETTPCNFQPRKSKKNIRIVSLDAFRGISLFMMIFLSYGHGRFVALDHAIWNGLQASDVPFPWFLWIMGVCVPISTYSKFKKGIGRRRALINIARRSCILFVLGLFLTSNWDLDTLRVFGVLQRFGLSYFVVATTFIFFPFGIRSNGGYLGPGGLHENGTHEGCTRGAAGYIDTLILGKHVYKHLQVINIYKTKAFDPEAF